MSGCPPIPAQYRYAAARILPNLHLRQRKPGTLARWRKKLAVEVELHLLAQFLFARQWQALHQTEASAEQKAKFAATNPGH